MLKISHLPNCGLQNNELSYLQQWEISEQPKRVQLDEGRLGIYVWYGSFVCDSTVTIVAREDMCVDVLKDPLFVGVVRREQVDNEHSLDAYIDAASEMRAGLAQAIFYLNEVHGLPDGTHIELGLFPSPVIVGCNLS